MILNLAMQHSVSSSIGPLCHISRGIRNLCDRRVACMRGEVPCGRAKLVLYILEPYIYIYI